MKKFSKASIAVWAVAITFGLVWSIAALAAGPATVDLGSAGNFVILTKSGISTTGSTKITGDIGVSPFAASAITGFGLLAPPTTSTTSALVTGKVYASDYDAPTPANMTTAVSNMETAYVDAAGRTPGVGAFLNIGAGTVASQTLAPGVYTWGSNVTITGDLTLSGGANDIWIFQITGTLDIASGKKIILSGGAQAKNIFWQVADATTLGTTSVFNGNILAKTNIAMQNGARLNGRALAQTAVTLIGNTIIVPTSSSDTSSDTSSNTSSNTSSSATSSDGSTTASIKVTKKASDSKLRLGPKRVTFTYEVTNKGNVALSDVSVKDDKCHSVKFVSGDSNDDSKLDITETWKYRCTKKVSETETNKVTASGTAGDLKVHDHAEVTVDVHETKKTTVPSLPNAGVGPEDTNSAPWNIIIPTGILAVLFSLYLARKKLAI